MQRSRTDAPDRPAGTEKLALGDTLLHVACRRSHAPLVRALLDENAKEGITNEEGLVPLDVAATDEVREEVSAAAAMTELLGPEFSERDRVRASPPAVRRCALWQPPTVAAARWPAPAHRPRRCSRSGARCGPFGSVAATRPVLYPARVPDVHNRRGGGSG